MFMMMACAYARPRAVGAAGDLGAGSRKTRPAAGLGRRGWPCGCWGLHSRRAGTGQLARFKADQANQGKVIDRGSGCHPAGEGYRGATARVREPCATHQIRSFLACQRVTGVGGERARRRRVLKIPIRNALTYAAPNRRISGPQAELKDSMRIVIIGSLMIIAGCAGQPSAPPPAAPQMTYVARASEGASTVTPITPATPGGPVDTKLLTDA